LATADRGRILLLATVDIAWSTERVQSALSRFRQLVYEAAGGAAVKHDVLDRCMRDVPAMNQHSPGSLWHYEIARRLLLGLPPMIPLF